MEENDKNTQTPKKKRSIFRRIWRITRNLFFGFIGFILLLAGLLQFPFVQTWLGRQATNYLNSHYDVHVSIGSIRYTLPNKLVLGDVEVLDHHQDTLLHVEELGLQVRSLALGKGLISFGNVYLEEGLFSMVTYKGEEKNNLSLLIDKFKPKTEKDPNKKAKRMVISISDIHIENVRVNIINENASPPPAAFESNKIRLHAIYGDVSHFQVASDSISFETKGLRAKEYSGLNLQELNSQVLICNRKISFTALQLVTDNSRLEGYYAMEYESFSDFSDFLNKIHMKADLSMSNIDMHDVAYFTKNLEGIDFSFRFKGRVNGPVSKMEGKGIRIYFGTVSQFNGDFLLEGLPNIDSTHIDFTLDKLATNYYDLGTLPVPPFNERKKLEVPEEIIRMGVLNFSGDFVGYINDFKANGDLHTNAGNAHTSIAVKNDTLAKRLSFAGKVELDHFNVGKVLRQESLLGFVSVYSDTLRGEVLNNVLNLDFEGHATELDFMGYTYRDIDLKNIAIRGNKYSGNIHLVDDVGNLDFNGGIDLTDKKRPDLNFTATIQSFNLTRSHLWPSDTVRMVSAVIRSEIKGINPDDLDGTLNISDLIFLERDKSIRIPELELQALDHPSGRQFKLNSDLINANFIGQFKFESLFNETKKRLNEVLPLLKLQVPDDFVAEVNNFEYQINFIRVAPILNIFLPDLEIAENSFLKGQYNNGTNQLDLRGQFAFLKYQGYRAKSLNITGTNDEGAFKIAIESSQINLTDSFHLDSVRLVSSANEGTIGVGISYKNNTVERNEGRFRFHTFLESEQKFNVDIDTAYFYLSDSLWRFENEREAIKIDTNRIEINDLVIYEGMSIKQLVSINGEISRKSNRPLRLVLTNFPVAFANRFLKESATELGGVLDGSFEVMNVLKKPYFTGDLTVSDFSVNNNLFGDFTANAGYDTLSEAILISSSLKRGREVFLDVQNAMYYPFRKEGDQIFGVAKLNELPVSLAAPFLKPDINNLTGAISGRVSISGKIDALKFEAALMPKGLGAEIAYTKAKYLLNFDRDSIRISDTKIEIPYVYLKGKESSGSAEVDAEITHNMFSDIRLNVHLRNIKELEVLNTTRKDNDQFFGIVYISSLREGLHVTGPVNDLLITGGIRAESGTVMNIPLDNSSRTSAAEFVTFVNSKADSLNFSNKADSASKFKYDVQVDASVDDGSLFRLIFDETAGDVIAVRGNGDFEVRMNSAGRFDLYGNYEISQGDYMFTLQGLANKKFTVKPGSSISWTGNIVDARLDVTAIYTANASVAPIMVSFDPLNADQYRSRQRVNCELGLKGSLDNPQIAMNLDFPNADENVRSVMASALGTQEEKDRQVFALLILNQFLPPESLTGTSSGGTGNVLSSTASSTSLELMTTQLNNWISKVNQDFNLKLDYQEGATSDQAGQVNVGVNYQFLEGRIVLDTDLGVSSGKSGENGNSGNNIVGNFNLEFKITKDGKLRAKAFNRSNENNLLKNSIPYTQGVSISYRRDFDSWRDLFKKKDKKSRKKDTPVAPNTSPADPKPEDVPAPVED